MYKLSLLPLKSRERSKRTFEIKLISNSNSSFKKSKKKEKISKYSLSLREFRTKKKGTNERREKLNF